jgi:hypothetical protein
MFAGCDMVFQPKCRRPMVFWMEKGRVAGLFSAASRGAIA